MKLLQVLNDGEIFFSCLSLSSLFDTVAYFPICSAYEVDKIPPCGSKAGRNGSCSIVSTTANTQKYDSQTGDAETNGPYEISVPTRNEVRQEPKMHQHK